MKNVLLSIFCSRLLFINWLQSHLLPCPFKYLTGIDCPGCGFQRAVMALLQGHSHQSFLLYPAAMPLLLFFGYSAADAFFKFDNSKGTFKKSFLMIVGAFVLISYGLKMWGLYHS
ncbi:MAG: DUF2752 domain-containing protein [Bacteroidota bacterium]